ncbi:MAG: ComF family protein [Pseudomonadales bacterium]
MIRKTSKQLFDRFTRLGRSQCILCLGHAQGNCALCQDCDTDLPRIHNGCTRCTLPFANLTEGLSQGLICGRCQERPPSYDRCIAPLRYDWPVDQLIPGLKFSQNFSNVNVLATLIVQQLSLSRADSHSLPDVLVPIPLHWRRHQQRGFNQSSLLAISISKQLAARTGLRAPKVDQRLIKRVVNTESQVGQSKKARRQNMRHAFRVRAGTMPASVALIDDVVTTGATVNEASRVLRKAGVQTIEVWCAARTPVDKW